MGGRSYYIETSVWGMIPKGQPKEMRKASLQLLHSARKFFASAVVLETPECAELAAYYIESGIISARRFEDGMHVAIATFHEVDVLVSWNHRHLANVRKTEQYRGANLIKRYSKTPIILTPFEVLYE